MRSGGHPFGIHRVVQPKGCLPQQADKLDVSLPIFDNELLIDVEALNIDSASFHQIAQVCNKDQSKIAQHISDLVSSRGKQHNPVTGSGGMLIGKVKEIGLKFLKGKSEELKVGDRVATLVSLTLTPLYIHKIKNVDLLTDKIDIEGYAVLFESGIFAKLPEDISETLSLAVLDVCGAPAQTEKICKQGQTVVVIGGAGKSGILSLYKAKKAVGNSGQVIGLDYSNEAVEVLKNFSFVDYAERIDARDALATYDVVRKITNNKMADVVINVANISDTEMSCILSTKPKGTVYFFSMATNFTKATLGAEGVAADVSLIMGNGYCPGHANLTLNILRESKEVREYYEKKYGTP